MYILLWNKQLIASSTLRHSRQRFIASTLPTTTTTAATYNADLQRSYSGWTETAGTPTSKRWCARTSSLPLVRPHGLNDSHDRHRGVLLVQYPRYMHLSAVRWQQSSSKVEETVKNLKQKEEETAKAAAAAAAAENDPNGTSGTPLGQSPASVVGGKDATAMSPVASQVAPAVIPKKSLKQRIWHEILHYYHGFRLLGMDVKVSCKLLWKVLNGEKLTRRENRLLVRTSSDMFRLVPFSVFIIVPFMELLLPVFIKFFPGMLPSTFQTAKDRDEKMKQHLKVKLEMAKFLQRTLDDMSVQHADHSSEAAKQFNLFIQRTREGTVDNSEEIIKFSKLFEDEMTLDSLSRQQLMALCRVLEVATLGTNNFLRFQLQLKLRSLVADDKIIQKEGVEALNLAELQAASRARGMRAYGMSEDHLRKQLNEWITLSVDEKVPPTLLLLSRAMLLPEDIPTSDKLKATISALPDTVVTQTRAAIGEREGKIDNRTKIEIIQEEVRRIKEEKEEEVTDDKATVMVDRAPVVTAKVTEEVDPDRKLIAETLQAAAAATNTVHPEVAAAKADAADATEISSADVQVLSNALGAYSKEKKTLLVEKEDLRDLKEEIADYKEDVKELHEVVTPQDQLHESRGAKLLHRKVDSMIGKLDRALEELERKEEALNADAPAVEASPEEKEAKRRQADLVHIGELLGKIKQVQQVDNKAKFAQIEKMLAKLDLDHDGHVKVDDILDIIETVAKDNVKLTEKQFDELINLLEKEEILASEREIQEALQNEMKLKKQLQLEQQRLMETKGAEEEIVDPAKVISSKDTKDMEVLSKREKEAAQASDDVASSKGKAAGIDTAAAVRDAVEKQNEKILPKLTDKDSVLPPPLPASDSQKTKSL